MVQWTALYIYFFGISTSVPVGQIPLKWSNFMCVLKSGTFVGRGKHISKRHAVKSEFLSCPKPQPTPIAFSLIVSFSLFLPPSSLLSVSVSHQFWGIFADTLCMQKQLLDGLVQYPFLFKTKSQVVADYLQFSVFCFHLLLYLGKLRYILAPLHSLNYCIDFCCINVPVLSVHFLNSFIK